MSLELALEWAARGSRVLPVSPPPAKRPLIKAWQEHATTDETTIREWWSRNPHARVGLATGDPGYDVLDFDVADGKPGLAQLEKLLDLGVIEPGTFMVVSTPSGGRHLYFRGTEQRNKQNERAIPGVDFRGQGGMVLAPGNDGYRIIAGRGLDRNQLGTVDWGAVRDALAVPEDTTTGPVAPPTNGVGPVRVPVPAMPPAPPRANGTTSRLKAPNRGYDDPTGEESPLDWYNRNHRFADLLAADGWTYSHTEQGRDYWTRPGKHKRDGVSGNVIDDGGREVFFNFSSSVPLPVNSAMSPAQYHAYTAHGGDVRAAASAIRREQMPRPARPSTPLWPQPATQQAPPGMAAPPAPTRPVLGTTGGELLTVRDAVRGFWYQRPLFTDMLWRAQDSAVSPWAVLGYVLAGVAARVGPHIQLPPLGQSKPASLNLLVAIEGNSGDGKGEAGKVAAGMLGGPHPPKLKPGTGQGIAAAYTEQKKEGPVQINDTALMNAAEISNLGAHADMQGSNLVGTLCEVYMAEELGEHYAAKEKRRPVREGSYRLALTVGVQPANSHMLLDHEQTGLPQRFLWMPAFWPDSELPVVLTQTGLLKPPAPAFDTRWSAWPAILPASLDPTMSTDGWTPTQAVEGKKEEKDDDAVPVKAPVLIEYAPEVKRIVTISRHQRRAAIAKRRSEGETGGDLDGHLVLAQLKVAALLALLDGRMRVESGDWNLASQVMQVSNDTRLRCKAELQAKAAKKTASRAAAQIATQAIVKEAENAQLDNTVKKSSDRIRTILASGEWVSSRVINQGVSGRDKKVLREAGETIHDVLTLMLQTGQIEQQTTGAGGGGVQYRLRTTA